MSYYTDPVDALYESSAKFRQEVERTGSFRTGYVPRVATNWGGTSKAEERELLGGFDPNKVSECCFMVLAKNGTCTGCGE